VVHTDACVGVENGGELSSNAVPGALLTANIAPSRPTRNNYYSWLTGLRNMNRSTFGERAFGFFTRLVPPVLPPGIAVMNPYADRRVRGYVRAFFERFYGDDDPRVLVLGINPGRFGAGLTGIAFTDPIALANNCGIENHLPRQPELSSTFVYMAIDRAGGVKRFCCRYLLTAVCPLGFVRGRRNLNYYDVPALRRAVEPFAVDALTRQIAIGGRRDHAIVLGAGKNLEFIERLNDRHGFFTTLHPLEHPRYIMQYRRRSLRRYLDSYERVFSAIP
jgi:hypothetical protein